MITQSQIYWLTRCNELRELLMDTCAIGQVLMAFATVLAVVCIAISVFAGNGALEMFSGMSDERFSDLKLTLRKWARYGFWVCIVSTMVSLTAGVMRVAVPTNKEMAAIIVVPRIANSQAVGDIGDGIVVLAKEWLEELRPRKEKTSVDNGDDKKEKAD